MRRLYICGIITLSFMILMCSSGATIRTEQPASPNLKNYKKVYIGWLDFGEGNWKKYGFKAPKDWSDAIRELNVNALQDYCRSELSGRTVTGSRGADAPAKNDLYVKLHLKKHEIGTGMNRIQYLYLDIRFTDMATGQTRYYGDVMIDTSGFGIGNFTMEGQLNFAMTNLAKFIGSKF
ncbi:MAG TPA: hypothetical protein PKN50_14310 [Spirochaetota bacterium]|nr:hypothetical protein [Spirochaetota bacterium]HPV43742.1 hypothetical protein [Spirochaetota bacterium]